MIGFFIDFFIIVMTISISIRSIFKTVLVIKEVFKRETKH